MTFVAKRAFAGMAAGNGRPPLVTVPPPADISLSGCLRFARKAIVLFACGAAPWVVILRVCGLI